MDDVVIRVENLSKRYRIGAREKANKTFREVLMDMAAAPFRRVRKIARSAPPEETIWALKDVSLEVKRGEVLGIIGCNGAGKSTLLKILSRITEPTEGRVQIRGRVASLLEVGTGFHEELTGRENIYLNGAILGMKKAEIDRKFDEIVAFSGVEKFMDTPVKRYSSGMYVRLAFAVAAHMEPEVLLVDEVLAVGDAAFQKKCLGKMGEVAKQGRTVLFVSHNMAAIENLCGGAVLLDRGQVIRRGKPPETIQSYLTEILQPMIEGVRLAERGDRSGNGRIRLTGFRVEDGKGAALTAVRSGMEVTFVFSYECPSNPGESDVDVGFSIHLMNQQPLFILYSSFVGQQFEHVPASGEVRCRLSDLPLAPGRYLVGARVMVKGQEADWPRNWVGYLDVEAGDFYGTGHGAPDRCPFMVRGSWSVETG
jgi:lipopolysaccharide transport system ATP-binding protein